MSAERWTERPEKTTPPVGADKLLLLNSESIGPVFNNEQISVENFNKFQSLLNTVIVRSAINLPNAVVGQFSGVSGPGDAVFTFAYSPEFPVNPYVNDQIVEIRAGTGISGYNVDTGGADYTGVPDVLIGPPDLPNGIQATAIAILAGPIVDLLDPIEIGSGYTSEPSVTFSGGGASVQATATADPPDSIDTTAYDGFHFLREVTSTTFKLTISLTNLGILQQGLTAVGSSVRCATRNTNFVLATPLLLVDGMRYVDGANLSITSTNRYVNTITMIGNSRVFLQGRSIGTLETDVVVSDGTGNPVTFQAGTNKLLDIVGGGFGTSEILFISNSRFNLFGSLGNISGVSVGFFNSLFIAYGTGFVTNNTAFNVARNVIFTVTPTSVFLTINNPVPDPFTGTLSSIFSGNTLTLPVPGSSIFNIIPNLAVENTVTLTNSTSIGAGDFFKSGTEKTAPITAYADSAGAPGVRTVVSSAGHGLENGQISEIRGSKSYNQRYIVSDVIPNVSYEIVRTFVEDDAKGTGTQVRNITLIANDLTNNGTVNTQTVSSFGFTTINITDFGTTLVNNDFVTLAGIGPYNGTHRISNIKPGVSFDILIGFQSDQGAGTWIEPRITLSILAHGITVVGTHVLVDETIFYDGGSTVKEITNADTLTLNGVFNVLETTGGIITDGSLDGFVNNVLVDTVSGELDSQAKCSIDVTGNGTASVTPTQLNDFKDINFGGLVVENHDNSLWRLINPMTGEVQYRGLVPFSGHLSATIQASKGGSQAKDYNFRGLKNGGPMIDDRSTPLSLVTQNAQSTTIIISIDVEPLDKIRLQHAQSDGTFEAITAISLKQVIQ